jgi:hypothetical protein
MNHDEDQDEPFLVDAPPKKKNDVEARWADLVDRAREQGGNIAVTLMLGDIKQTAVYKITPLDDTKTLSGSLDTIERLLDDPRFAEAAKANLDMEKVDALVQDVKFLVNARGEDYRIAIEAFHQFAIGEGLPVESERRETIQDLIRLNVRDEVLRVLTDDAARVQAENDASAKQPDEG